VLVILCKHTNNFFHILDIPSSRKSNMPSIIRNKTCVALLLPQLVSYLPPVVFKM